MAGAVAVVLLVHPPHGREGARPVAFVRTGDPAGVRGTATEPDPAEAVGAHSHAGVR